MSSRGAVISWCLNMDSRIVDKHLQQSYLSDSLDLSHLNLSSIDRLFFHIAHLTLQLGGHRYGSFLEAATTAAKLSVYISYLEHGRSLKKTGLLHHIEPKRVKEIIREVEFLMVQDQCSSDLANQEPEFLIGIPNLWLEYFPWSGTGSPLTIDGLTPKEVEALIRQLPQKRPEAKIISEIEFLELLDSMHSIAHQKGLSGKQKTFSNALREHYVFKVLHSGMVVKLRPVALDMNLYALVRMSYSPRQLSARLNTLYSDLANTIEILQLWIHNSPYALRALESLDIKLENQPAALAELDQLLRTWADKHHDEAGTPVLLQLAAGPHTLP